MNKQMLEKLMFVFPKGAIWKVFLTPCKTVTETGDGLEEGIADNVQKSGTQRDWVMTITLTEEICLQRFCH